MRSVLAMLAIGVVGLQPAGCRKTQPPAPRYAVRMQDLLPLHPLWARSVILQESPAEQENRASQRLPGHVFYPLPPPFPEPGPLPPDLTQERQRRLETDARRYVQQLEEFLRQRANDALARLERAERKAIEARLTDARERRIAAETEENRKQAQRLIGEITRLRIRRIAFESQVRTFKGQPRSDAQKQLGILDARIAALEAERARMLDDVRPRIFQEIEQQRDQLLNELAERMRARRAAEERAIAEALSSARERLRFEAEAFTPLRLPEQDTPHPQAMAQLREPATRIAESTRDALQTAQHNSRAAWEAHRQRLRAVIRADTEKTVQQIAQHEGWIPVPPGTPGAPDRTEQVAQAIRRIWRQHR
ncbi:MAG: hypothetical protein RMJ43_09265 [Chloroherpetonaceae bacterium]|nr:hypothetical protein [Chthonomonadaceae bacterium]MDW8208012.1 hypothetical protein [Chloroherpetonaceae bacterium]